jgi:Tol biopolymer transport system component
MISTARIGATLALPVLAIVLIASCDGLPGGTAVPATSRAPGASTPPGSAAARESVGPEPAGRIDLATLTGRIAFAAGAYPALDLYVVNADGSGFRRLTTGDGAEFDPSWSPDGLRIAYRLQGGGEDSTSDIDVLDLATGQSRNVSGEDDTPDWGPAWSPDGSLIAWNTAANTTVGFDLGLVRPDGTDRRVVRANVWVEYPAWSPDGTRIAFMSQVADEGNQYEVFVMDADGTNVRRLTNNRAGDGWPTWSPDGSLIAFASTRDDCDFAAPPCLSTGDVGPFQTLYTMSPDGTKQRRVSSLFGQIADWSPDGRYLVFESIGGLTVVAADGSAMATIPVPATYPSFPDWAR